MMTLMMYHDSMHCEGAVESNSFAVHAISAAVVTLFLTLLC